MKIYDCLTFKELSILKLPVKPRIFEITEENSILLYSNNLLIYYTFDLEENKVNFKFYITDIYLFKYLPAKKEIYIMNANKKGSALISLTGDVLFYEKDKPDIFFEGNDIKYLISKNKDFHHDGYEQSSYYNYLNGFDKDKYLIFTSGYSISVDLNEGSYSDEDYSTSIYSTSDLKEVLSTDIIYINTFNNKISDKLFYGNYIFYYDEKVNDIKFVKDFYEGDYFYLSENKFLIYIQPDTFYIIDLSEKKKKNLNGKLKIILLIW